MSFNCGLSNGKISASVIVNEKWKASISAQNFAATPKDVPVKDILAAVADGLRGITPSKADLIRGKVVSNIWNNMRSRSVLTKKVHMKLQKLTKDPSIIITRPVTSLGHQWGKIFCERPKVFNYVNTFFQGEQKFLGRPPSYGSPGLTNVISPRS